MLQKHRLGLTADGYILVEKIDNARDLARFFDDLDAQPAEERRKILHAHIDQLARIIREMHRRRVSQRDLKAGNILVSPNITRPAQPPLAQNNAGVFPCFPVSMWLIDLVAVERLRELRFAVKVQNLARLNASFIEKPRLTRTDRLRFLRVYMQWAVFGKGPWKKWWRAIDEATRRKVARTRRLGRPVG